MIKSMTGFGRGEYKDERRTIVAEIRSVNHRYCDISVKMPRRYGFAEDRIKNAVKEAVRRGKAEVSIQIENLGDQDAGVRLNGAAAGQYYENLKELKEMFGLKEEITLSLLASLPDVLKMVPDVEDEEEAGRCLEAAVREAAGKLDEMRRTEGAALERDLLDRGMRIREMTAFIRERAPEVAAAYTEKLKIRIAELIGSSAEIPEDRVLLEAAIFADKCSIAEELVRLDSHLLQLEKILTESTQPDGKKLDFLVQEMNREANTIGSKANDLQITGQVLEIKSEIEKIREQVQNIE